MTDQAQNQEPLAAQGDDDDSDLATELDAMLAAARVVEPAPAAAGQEPSAAAVASPAGAPTIAEDAEERLLAQARTRMAERKQREPLEHVQRQLADLQANLAKAPGITAIARAVAAGDHGALAGALAAAGIDLGKVQQLATKAKLQPSPVDQIAALIDAKLAPVLALVQPKTGDRPAAAEQTPEERATVIDSYGEYIQGAADMYPLQAELGEYAPHAAMAYLRRKFWEQGLDPETAAEVRDLTHAQVAGMFEKELDRQKAARLKPPRAPTIASGEPTTQPPGAPSTASGGPTKTTSAPRSLMNGHAAAAARSLPRNRREEDEQLARDLEDIKRAAG